MLDEAARVAAYQEQNNYGRLTARQQRRVNHKRNHQSAQAFDQRAARSVRQTALREERTKNHLTASLAASA